MSKAIAKLEESVNEQIRVIENEFSTINKNIELKILNATETLNESLNVIDDSLSSVLKNVKPVNKMLMKKKTMK